MTQRKSPDLPDVTISEQDGVRFLHLDSPWIQGSMTIKKPFEIELEYVQRMMAWLLFVDLAQVKTMRTLHLGLGAATATKFCHKTLKASTTTIELNPQVIAACRMHFKLPPDDARLRVVLADAGLEIQKPEYAGTVDALHVDLYDAQAAAPVLDSAAFYGHCRALLSERGAMTVNLFGRYASYEASVKKIAQAFGADALWAFKPTREGNAIVLAQRSPSRPPRNALMQQAEAIEAAYALPALKWLRVFKPIL